MPRDPFQFSDLAYVPFPWLVLTLVGILWWPANLFVRTLIFYVTLRTTLAQHNRPELGFWQGRWEVIGIWYHAFLGAAGLTTSGPSSSARLAHQLSTEVIGAGPWLGVMERTIVFLLSAVGDFPAVAFVMAAKGLIVQGIKGTRAKPLALVGVGEADETPSQERMIEIKQESYLLGTFFSFAIAITSGVVVAEWARLCKAHAAHQQSAGKLSPDQSNVRLNVDTKQQIVLMDVDTGVDDALAILLALHSPQQINLVGITTVSGNVSSVQAALNTHFLLKQFRDFPSIPVTVGARQSLHGRVPTPVPHIHGEDGLGGVSNEYWKAHANDKPRTLEPDKAVDFILETAKKYGKQLTIVATGPLTNIALAIQKDRDTMSGIGQIYAMGGALDTPGNITPFAEFNVHCDPKAFSEVVRSGISFTLFPLDVTEKAHLFTKDITSRKDVSTNERNLIESIMKTYAAFHEEKYKFQGSFVHDALPVAALLEPSLFTFRTGEVEVEVAEPAHFGQTRWAGPKIRVATTVKEGDFLHLFWQQLHNGTDKCIFDK